MSRDVASDNPDVNMVYMIKIIAKTLWYQRYDFYDACENVTYEAIDESAETPDENKSYHLVFWFPDYIYHQKEGLSKEQWEAAFRKSLDAKDFVTFNHGEYEVHDVQTGDQYIEYCIELKFTLSSTQSIENFLKRWQGIVERYFRSLTQNELLLAAFNEKQIVRIEEGVDMEGDSESGSWWSEEIGYSNNTAQKEAVALNELNGVEMEALRKRILLWGEQVAVAVAGPDFNEAQRVLSLKV